MTNVSLDLISDPDMYLTCEQIRGGVSMISKRYANANNPFMGDEFDSKRLQIVESMLSDFQKSFPHSIASSIKLCPNFFPKSSYAVHYRTLKFYLSQGLILTNILKILSFNQSPWLKPYIDFNTDQRKQAKSEFEKSFWKLLNNSVYGKIIENLRKRVRVEVVTEP
ncbi:hypothetical protein LAZ67_7001212 [Cordylochernes scorpioides]|uniref:DNA-directed DNA polymerase n=1 Tax=Cordylochernes scorpioides TaxID=51811 RepID=A0ABY6KNL1_9ARAC|nr:hypothetical protein LAZ67_7001212 [Cordylochernes scorpioides]